MTDWESEMGALVHGRRRALVGYAYLLTGSVGDAEDLVQDALVKVYSRRTVPTLRDAEGYVKRTIFTIYLDGYRRRNRWSAIRHLVGGADRQESASEAAGGRLDVASALATLPPRQRASVVLRYYDDLTVPQVAEQLGCSPGAVKRYLFEAHASLHTLLGPFPEATDQPDAHPTDQTPAQTPAQTPRRIP